MTRQGCHVESGEFVEQLPHHTQRLGDFRGGLWRAENVDTSRCVKTLGLINWS